MASNPSSHPHSRGPVTPVGYAPPDGYALDIEVYPFAELRSRAGDVAQRGFERTNFHCLLYVTAGRYAHIVDFELHECGRGSVIVLQPGQVHHFGDLSGCDGWALILRSEVLPARAANAAKVSDLEAMEHLEDLPVKLSLQSAAQSAATETFERMVRDADRPASRAVNALLRSQLEAFVIRLHIDSAIPRDDLAEPVLLHRFKRYRTLVEREFRTWRSVALYAAELGCSEKSLSRAALAVADRSAKSILTDRIILEAKRLLAHSLLPVANVGHELGFSEPTNFVKFFRRETRSTPGAFRQQMSAGANRAGSRPNPKLK